MASSRKTIRRGQKAVIEEVSRDGERAYFVRCTDRLLNQNFDNLPDAEAYLEAVERGTAPPPF